MNRPYYRAFTNDETPQPEPPQAVQIDGYQIEFDQKVMVMPVEVIATPPAPAANGTRY